MTQQDTLLPLTFQLSGEGVQMTYVTSDQDGQPHLTYKDAEFDRSYSGEEIRMQQSEFGSLATVTLRIIPDAFKLTLTLVIPRVWRLQSSSDHVEMLAVKCMDRMTMLPQPGAAQSYEAILLRGSMQSSSAQ